MGEKKPFTAIRESKLPSLLRSGEWMTDIALGERIRVHAGALRQKHGMSLGEWRPDDKLLTDFFTAAPDVAAERLESLAVVGEWAPNFTAEMRVSVNRVFKVQDSALSAVVGGLGLVLAIAATPLTGFLLTWSGLSLLNLIRVIARGFESINDPDERLVFETVAMLQGKFCTINYRAILGKNFDFSYKFVCPESSEVAQELAGQLDPKAVEKSLASLKARGILTVRAGRWAVAW